MKEQRKIMKEQRKFESGYYRLNLNSRIDIFDNEYYTIDRFCFGQKSVRIDFTDWYEGENDGADKCFINNNLIFVKGDDFIIFDDDKVASRFDLERKYVYVEVETENGRFDSNEYNRIKKEEIIKKTLICK